LRAKVVDCLLGIFAFDEGNRVIDTAFFPKEEEVMADSVSRIRRGEIVGEVSEIVEGLLEKGYGELVFENSELAGSVSKEFSVETSFESPSRRGRHRRFNLCKLALEKDYVKSIKEFHRLVHGVTTLFAVKAIRKASGRRDLLISQAILTIDDLDKTFNLFSNRLREWYGYHFPELSSSVDKNEKYLRLIASLGRRNDFTVEKLAKEGATPEQAEAIAAAAESSMGAEMGEDDISEVQGFAKSLLVLYDSRNSLESYLDRAMKEVAPNIRGLVGPTLGARLISKVGGLKNLAKKSSSTIQLLGAEKALFRSLRTGTRPPKHGLIFQHKEVHKSPRWQRGKIARALAGKIAIAARLDAYGEKYTRESLRQEFEERVDEIRDKYSEPPSRRGK
jgi:nucleolar protein 56